MCGRVRCTLRADDIPRACYRHGGAVRTVNIDRYRPSYNVSPGANVPVLLREDGSDGEVNVVHCMKWGLVPSFTKKTEKPDHYMMFNARSESIREKASFRRLIPKSRCLVAVEGFYEWKKDGSKKQPYYIHFRDGRPLVFAALYDSWQNSEGDILYTCTILTTSSCPALQWLHDRMPVILGDKESADAWLKSPSPSNLNLLLKPFAEPDLVWYPVTPAMGKSSFDGPECVKEIQLKTEGSNSISKFFSKREIKSELELKPKQEGSCNSKTDPWKGLKEESKTGEGEHGSKSIDFPSKGIMKKEQDSNSGSEVPSKEPMLTNKPKGLTLKEEPEIQESEHDSKSNVSASFQQESSKTNAKRDHEEFSGGDKIAHTSPAKKKKDLKTVGDKQRTLFSFFGKG